MFTEVIETPRLILRPFTMDDVDASYEVNLDPEVSRYTNDGGVRPYDEMKSRIFNVIDHDYQKYNFGRFAVIYKDTNEFIGFSGLKYLPEFDEVDLGYRFKQNYWGKGIATESSKVSLDFGFYKLNLEKIVCMAIPENTASVNVMTKLGFTYDSKIMEDGTLIDKYILLKEDWH